MHGRDVLSRVTTLLHRYITASASLSTNILISVNGEFRQTLHFGSAAPRPSSCAHSRSLFSVRDSLLRQSTHYSSFHSLSNKEFTANENKVNHVFMKIENFSRQKKPECIRL